MKIYSSFVNPGEMVGIVASHTLGEQSTQLVLNTFHLSGVGSAAKVVTAALPRLAEIIRMSNNMANESMEVYLKDEYTKDKNEIKKLCSRFKYTQLKDIIKYTEILYIDEDDVLEDDEDDEYIKVYNEFNDLFDLDNQKCDSKWVLKIVFDKYSILNNITLSTIQEIIKQKGNSNQIKCIFNDDNADNIILRISIQNSDNSLEVIQEIEDNITDMKLMGIPNINSISIGQDKHKVVYNSDGSYEEVLDTVLYTTGTNLREFLQHDYVDTTRTNTNNINEVYEVLGIEAARSLIIIELSEIYKQNRPNPKHIELMSDLITYRGILMQLDRHGINRKDDSGVISKASFEEIMNMFVKAAVFGETDNMKGVSANIMMGQMCKLGTNSFDVLLSTEEILNIEPSDDNENNSKLNILNSKESLDDNLIKEFKNNIKFNDNILLMDLTTKDEYKLHKYTINNVKIVTNKKYNKYREKAIETTDEEESSSSDDETESSSSSESESNESDNESNESENESKESDNESNESDNESKESDSEEEENESKESDSEEEENESKESDSEEEENESDNESKESDSEEENESKESDSEEEEEEENESEKESNESDSEDSDSSSSSGDDDVFGDNFE